MDIDEQLRIDPQRTRSLLVDFIRTQLAHAGYRKGVIGLSGGLDSALSCYLAAEALGPKNVLALLLPYRTSDPASRDDALEVIRRLGVASETIDITPMVEPYFERCPDMSARRQGNVMARMRMIVLYDHSESWNGLVIGTSNKTETYLGYGTLFGDMAAAIQPLGDLYKTQARQLASAMQLPESIQHKPPSADLWKGQTDEGELGFAYVDLDRALHLLVDQGYNREQAIAHGLSPDLVARVQGLMQKSAFKRRPQPVAKLPLE